MLTSTRERPLLARAAALSVLILTPTAHAYIDPGTGSLILQGLIAAVAGISVTAGICGNRVKVFFRGGTNGA